MTILSYTLFVVGMDIFAYYLRRTFGGVSKCFVALKFDIFTLISYNVFVNLKESWGGSPWRSSVPRNVSAGCDGNTLRRPRSLCKTFQWEDTCGLWNA